MARVKKVSKATHQGNIGPRRARGDSHGSPSGPGKNNAGIRPKAVRPTAYVGSEKGPTMPIYNLIDSRVLEVLVAERWAERLYQ